MGLETGTYVGDLNTANPLSNDPKSQGDDHLRLIKTVLKNTFSGFAGMVVATGSEAQGDTVNDYVVTVSPAPAAYTANTFVVFKATHTNTGAATLKINALTAQTLKDVEGNALSSADIANGAVVVAWYDGTSFFVISGNDRADRSGETYTGSQDFTGATLTTATQSQGDNSTKAASTAYTDTGLALKANIASPALTGTPTAPTASPGTNTTQLATTAFVVQQAFQAALPAQGGNAGKYLQTDGTNASWQFSGITGYASKTGAYTLVATDKEKLIDCTSGTFTLSFTAAATLGSTWAVYVRNRGSGDITLDPNGSETIDGLTSYLMYPGETRLIFCDGSSFFSVVMTPFSRTFTASGTFTKPPGYAQFGGLAWAGGASGASNATNSGGGGGGACAPFMLAAAILGATVTVTIGAGGSAVTGASGNVGGNTTFGAFATAYGGGAPSSIPAGGGGIFGVGGLTFGGLPAIPGTFSDGTNSWTIPESYGGGAPHNTNNSYAFSVTPIYGGGASAPNATSASYTGHNSLWGGAGGGTIASNAAIAAGTSTYGGNGGAASVSGVATAGTAPGGGGGANGNGTAASGAGARGELRIWGDI